MDPNNTTNNANNAGNPDNAVNSDDDNNAGNGNTSDDTNTGKEMNKCWFSFILSGLMLVLAIIFIIRLMNKWSVLTAMALGIVTIVAALQTVLCVFHFTAASWTIGSMGLGFYLLVALLLMAISVGISVVSWRLAIQ